MPPPCILANAPPLPAVMEPERRLHRRYPIALHVQYTLRKREEICGGSGGTVDISTGGVIFKTKDPLPPSGEIDLTLDWPFLLNHACALKLLAHGWIVRSDTKGTAVRVVSYDFGTSTRR